MVREETNTRFHCAVMQPCACRRVGERVVPAAQRVRHSWSLGKVRSGQHARRHGLTFCAACVASMQGSIAHAICFALCCTFLLSACQPALLFLPRGHQVQPSASCWGPPGATPGRGCFDSHLHRPSMSSVTVEARGCAAPRRQLGGPTVWAELFDCRLVAV
jgi:hypothetical protein